MTPFLVATANGLHALTTVIFVGYYLLLSLLYLPALAKPDRGGGMALGEISRRSRRWLYTSLLIFALTGVYLTLVDANYLGIGHFSNPWAILMLVKHILILAMIAIGLWYNAIQRVGPALRSNIDAAQTMARFRRYSNLMAVCGVLVLLLTASAQVMQCES
jgi:uncharacterized membrane protein